MMLINNLPVNLDRGMFYLMADGVPPIWDDPSTANGGRWTFKSNGSNVGKLWRNLISVVTHERLSTRKNHILGISLSPKTKNITVSIWTSDTDKMKDCFYGSGINFEGAWFLANRCNDRPLRKTGGS